MKDIKNVQTQNIFRLSAILYSKTNDIVSNKSIIRRVIEDALYCCGSDIITISELITYIHSNRNKYLKRIYLVPWGGFAGLNNDHIADFLDKKYCLGGYEGVWPGWGRNLFGGMKMKL